MKLPNAFHSACIQRAAHGEATAILDMMSEADGSNWMGSDEGTCPCYVGGITVSVETPLWGDWTAIIPSGIAIWGE